MSSAALSLFDAPPAAPAAPSTRHGFETGIAVLTPTAEQVEHGVYPTPMWVAEALVEQFFPSLDETDCVADLMAGTGRWLRAIPAHVPAFGVELDAARAREAERLSGRRVHVGDFRTVRLDLRPTAIVGNPCFRSALIDALLDRSYHLLPEGGRVGLILPAYYFQTSRSVLPLADRWGIEQHMMPRDVFPGLSKPLCFALFSRSRERSLVGFCLYRETAAVRELRDEYRAILTDSSEPVWREVVRTALEALGGEADLAAIYQEVEGRRSARQQQAAFWKEKVRQKCQRFFVRTGPGRYALPA